MEKPLKLTAAQIDLARSKKGAWTRETLASWGVPWPPPKGWRKALLEGKPIPIREKAYNDKSGATCSKTIILDPNADLSECPFDL